MEKSESPSLVEYLPVITLTLIAVLLRIPYLDRPLVGDEAMAFNKYGMLSWQRILFYYDDTNQHSLFNILANGLMWLFGEKEVYFRLPSFLAGVFAVPLLYRLGRILSISHSESLLASSLLIFSHPHLTYSQEGRGYALTVFLALVLILSATRLLQRRSVGVWGALLIASGFCLVVNIPSNAFFLAATGVYCLTVKLQESNRRFTDKNFVSIAIVFFALLVFVGLYLGNIYTELKGFANSWNATSIARLEPSLFLHIAEFLIPPWGLGLYIFFIFGWFCLKSKNNVCLFASIFVTPVILMFATRTGGFGRTYIYFLPFILILISLGIMGTVNSIKKFSPVVGKFFAAVIAIVMLFQVKGNLAYYYEFRPINQAEHLTLYHGAIQSSLTNASMAEARQVYSYIQAKIPNDQLIVLSRSSDDVLNHYLQKHIHESARFFFYGKQPDKIIIITRRDRLPWVHPISGGKFTVPHDSVREIAAIGDTRIYEFNRKIDRLFPPAYDPDYEVKLLKPQDSKNLKIEINVKTRVVGEQSLEFENTTGQVLTLSATVAKAVDIKEGSYLLLAYLREWGQQSDFFLMDNTANDLSQVDPTLLLPVNRNYRMPADGSGFLVDPAEHIWEKVFYLYPIKPGQQDLTGIFNLVQKVSYFDGIQSFILSK